MKRVRIYRYLALGLVMLAALVYLLVSGMERSMVYYMTLEELYLGGVQEGDGLRLAGVVEEGSLVGDPLGGGIDFVLTDGSRRLPVSYRGVVPDTFEEGGELVVEGAYTGLERFDATLLIPKCPSKYEAQQPEGSS